MFNVFDLFTESITLSRAFSSDDDSLGLKSDILSGWCGRLMFDINAILVLKSRASVVLKKSVETIL